MWSLYLVRTACDRLYTGITTDVERRFRQHSKGRGAKALRGKGPLTLEFHTPIGDRAQASRVEYRVKQLTRAQKEAVLIRQALPEHCLEPL
ncbi:GIY-YIG nuclease family protein [Ferrimonas sediminicola]|uniref:GIY-YIG nuclease family protein n=1 Tax=Ferrimonas sediminicola TaxID=2569538 RepID=A0A4U1BBW9_9GAMM|nr:GIY-YIG nuclease family protein [Ferrimonas sediminicola]